MNIRIEKKKPKTTIHILTKIDGYKAIDFLIDTGFTQSLAIFGDFDKIIPIYDVKNISIVPYSEWLVVADGRKVQTFKGKTVIKIDEFVEETEILLVDTKGKENALLGISFMNQNHKRLLLDFKEHTYTLT